MIEPVQPTWEHAPVYSPPSLDPLWRTPRTLIDVRATGSRPETTTRSSDDCSDHSGNRVGTLRQRESPHPNAPWWPSDGAPSLFLTGAYSARTTHDPNPHVKANAARTDEKSTVVSLLDLDFADLPVAAVASRTARRLAGSPFRYIVTPNADHLARLSGDPALQRIYREALFCLLDSRVVAILGRALGIQTPAVAAGSDLTAELLAHHLHPGERITIIGLAPALMPALVKNCGLAPPAHFDPPMGFDHDPVAFAAAVAFVQDNPARFVFLAVGSPRQEYLAAAIAAAGGATGTALCVGASLEFLAGARRRAPRFMRRIGLEWLFRLVTEPVRLYRRYLIESPKVVGLLLKQRWMGGRSARARRA